MSTQILIKRSTTTGAVPTTSDIAVGELAINTVDKRIFTNNSGTIVELGTTPTTQAVTGNASVGGTFDVVGAVTVGNFTADGTVDLTSATVTIPAPTADAHPATKKYVDDEVNAILAGAPAALDTLNEIAAAINDDANVYTTLTNSIATKLSLSGGTMTGSIDMGANSVTTSADPATANTLTRKSYVDGLYQSTVDAEVSAEAAAASATAAAGSASSAATSATTATTQASAASTSATSAASSATAAATSATSSANSATASATSATQSASSATAAQALVDSIEVYYLGAEASAPTVDDNGDPLQAGAWYFNTTDSSTYIYNGSSWQSVSPDLVSDLTPQLGGDLDLNGKSITGSGTLNITDNMSINTNFGEITGTSNVRIDIDTDNNNTDRVFMLTHDGGSKNILQASESGNVSFFNSAGTSSKMSWNAGNEALTFADNAKAIFGAGSDLQIYHDGSSSYVKDAGTGSLSLQTNGTQINLYDTANGQTLASFINGGANNFYHNGSVKLATTSTGIDVTGTATMDGLTVDSGADTHVTIDGTASSLVFDESDTTDVNTRLRNQLGDFYIQTINDARTAASNRLSVDHATGDISFYEDTGTTAKFFWDASAEALSLTGTGGLTLEGDQDLGINVTTSGSAKVGRADRAYMTVGRSDFDGYLAFTTTTSGSGGLTERMRIDSSGNVGIGESTPLYALHITRATGSAQLNLEATDGTSESSIFFSDTTNAVGRFEYNHTSNYLRTVVNSSEAMRLDSSGNLLVGTTDTFVADNTTGNGLSYRAAAGDLGVAASNTPALYANRMGSDGDIAVFRKDGTTVGSIGSRAGVTSYYVLDPRAGGMSIHGVGKILRPGDQGGTFEDATIGLGDANYRFKDLYLSGGVYLGGTGAANKLDDYETGTFTARVDGSTTAGSGTYSAQLGKYTKVGNQVTVHVHLAWSAHTGTGNIRVAGLPFTVDGQYRGICSIEASGLTYTGTDLLGRAEVSSTHISVNQTSSGSAASVPMDTSVNYLFLTCTYTAA